MSSAMPSTGSSRARPAPVHLAEALLDQHRS
jgi:hypothetical protein